MVGVVGLRELVDELWVVVSRVFLAKVAPNGEE